MVVKMTTLVIPKFVNNKINTLGQDIHNNKFLGNWSNIVFYDHFSSGHENDH